MSLQRSRDGSREADKAGNETIVSPAVGRLEARAEGWETPGILELSHRQNPSRNIDSGEWQLRALDCWYPTSKELDPRGSRCPAT